MITLGSNTVGIGLVLRLRDEFSNTADRINNRFNKLYGNANRAFKQNLVAARQVGLAMMIAGASGTATFANMVSTAADFNYTLSGVKAVTRATTEEMKLLHDQAIAVGMTSKFTAIEVASAMEFLSKAGFRIPDVRSAIKGVADLGAAADLAIGGKEGAAGIMANILNTFGMAARQSTNVADVMAQTSVKSSVDMLDLAESIKYAGSVATTLKIPFVDLNAMLGVLGNAGMRGSMAGVGVANMLMYLAKAVGPFRTRRQSDALTMLGLNPKALTDARGNLKPMIEVVDIFINRMKKLSSTQQVSILEGLMNIRGARAFVPLMRETEIGMSLPEFLENLKKEAGGAAAEMAKIRMNQLKGDLMILRDTWDAFRISVGETLEPIARFGTKFATKVLGGVIKFVNTPFGKPLIIIAAGLSVATLVAGAFLVAFTSIKLLTIASTVSFANMGKTLTWAWNSGAASALRYATAARTATLVGGRWRDIATGRFVKAPAALPAAGTGASFLSKILGNTGVLANILSKLTPAFKGILGVASIIGSAVTFAFGFKNVIKGIVFGLGYLTHMIITTGKIIYGVLTNGPWSWGTVVNQEMSAFRNRTNQMRKNMGFEEVPMKKFTGSYKEDTYSNTVGLKEKMAALQVAPKPTSIHMDGKKVGEVIWQNNQDSLQKLLEVSN